MVEINTKKIDPSKKVQEYIKPRIIYLPLENKREEEYKHLVKEGDYVYKGDVVAINTKTKFPLHSSVSGYVIKGTMKKVSSGKLIKCIVIENDFKEKYRTPKGTKKEINKLTKKEFIEALFDNGITGLSGSNFPTYLKYKGKVKYLIVNGVECEPYNSCDNAIMYQNTEEILEVVDAIMEINNIKKAYIAINETNTKVINKYLKYINTYPNIKIYLAGNYYPSGWQKDLVENIFHITYNKLPMEQGIVVNNISTIYSIYEMLKYQVPLTERIITIIGDGVKKQTNVKVKIGSNLSEIIPLIGGYKKDVSNHLFITGGPLNGTSHPDDDIIVTKDLTSVLVLENIDEKVYPCIKCGKCIKNCPVKLKPIFITNNINNKDKLKKLHPEKCIKCGLCSYICPSRIELKEIIKKARDICE